MGIKPLRNTNDYFEVSDLNDSLRESIELGNLKALGYSKNIFLYNPNYFDIDKNRHKYVMYRKNKKKDNETMDISVYLFSIVGTTLFILLFDMMKKQLN